MAVVPNRSDVLKQSSLQSFKTRRLSFAMDGKIRTGTDARGSTQTGLVLTWTSKLGRLVSRRSDGFPVLSKRKTKFESCH
ncbi:hypothetical protein FS559_03925 [Treponema phagedenis]|nr:hypothetical protein FS559_03925 [Treponema phagedenis]